MMVDNNSTVNPANAGMSGYYNLLQSAGGFQSGTCPSPGSIKRYWSTASMRKALGLGYSKVGTSTYYG
jgi:hypothetical protein